MGRSRGLGQRNALILEVVALADRGAQALLTADRIEQSRGGGNRDLVRVADPVAAEIAVFGEELREIEIVDRGVERGNLVLTAMRYVDVIRARLERLDEVAAEETGISLEHEPGVDARDRQHAIDVRVLRRRILQVG